MYAAHGNNPHTTNELLLKNANFSAINGNGDTAYSIAVKKENYVGKCNLRVCQNSPIKNFWSY